MAHGDSVRLYQNNKDPVRLDDVLNVIHDLQKEMGNPVLKRLEFMGCSTFTNLNDKWVKYLRDKSKEMGIEIVGNTKPYLAAPIMPNEPLISFKDGEVGRFTQGSITPFFGQTTAIVAIPGINLVNKIKGYKSLSDNWVSCHEGRTQEDGEACNVRLAEDGTMVQAKNNQWNARIQREQDFFFHPDHPDQLKTLKVKDKNGQLGDVATMLRNRDQRQLVFDQIDESRSKANNQEVKEIYGRMMDAAQQFVELEERRTVIKASRVQYDTMGRATIVAPTPLPPS
jgi:hypothetical protein